MPPDGADAVLRIEGGPDRAQAGVGGVQAARIRSRSATTAAFMPGLAGMPTTNATPFGPLRPVLPGTVSCGNEGG